MCKLETSTTVGISHIEYTIPSAILDIEGIE